VTATLPTVLVATWRNGLFALADGVFHEERPGQSVKGLARDHRGNALAIIGGKSLCRRTAEGAWHTIAQGDLELSCCVAAGANLYVGANDAAEVLRVGDDGRLEHLGGFDQVPGRETWYAGTALIEGRLLGPPLGIRSMSATCDGKVIFANVHVGGIPRSLDGGVSWQPTIEIDSDVHQVCAHPTRPELVIAATGTGLAISRDSGATWNIERDGLHAQYCSAVGFAGDDLLVAASADHFAPLGTIYRRPIDGGGPLIPAGGGLPRWTAGIADTGNIAAHGSSLAIADHGGNLYLSQDAGDTWSKHGDGLPVPSSVLVY
jgi:hypothetical protein